MKILILSLILSLSASASFYVVNCSNADSSFSSLEGHTGQGTVYRIFDHTRNITKTIKISNFDQRVISKSVVKDSSKKVCSESGGGYVSWEKLEVITKVITLKDGKLFNSSLSGVSQDRTSLTVTLLCETKGNSRASCN